jgi:four helix bundle protein
MKRAAVSIPSNIAEGQARRHINEFSQFLYIANGSLAELDTQRLIAQNWASYQKSRVST